MFVAAPSSCTDGGLFKQSQTLGAMYWPKGPELNFRKDSTTLWRNSTGDCQYARYRPSHLKRDSSSGKRLKLRTKRSERGFPGCCGPSLDGPLGFGYQCCCCDRSRAGMARGLPCVQNIFNRTQRFGTLIRLQTERHVRNFLSCFSYRGSGLNARGTLVVARRCLTATSANSPDILDARMSEPISLGIIPSSAM